MCLTFAVFELFLLKNRFNICLQTWVTLLQKKAQESKHKLFRFIYSKNTLDTYNLYSKCVEKLKGLKKGKSKS